MPPRQQTATSTAEAVKGYIRDHGLEPGSLLPTESTLCAELGVSRSSVREAIRTLSTLDIVEVRHGRGMYVGSLSLAPLVSGLVFRGALNRDGTFRTLREVLQVRLAVDLGVAEELVAAYQGTTNPDLRELVEQMRTRGAAGQTFIDQDGEFHRRLLSSSDNQIVRELGVAFWQVHSATVPLLGIPTPADIDRTVQGHEDILTALEQGDLAAYSRAVVAHYQPLEHALEQALAAAES